MGYRGMITLLGGLYLASAPVWAQEKPEPLRLPDAGLVSGRGWSTYHRPGKVRLSHPRGYRVSVHPQGRIEVVGNKGRMDATTPYLLVQPFIAHRGESAHAYLKRAVLPTYMRLADPTIERIAAPDPRRATALIRYAVGRFPRHALVHCTLQGRSGMAYFLATTVRDFPDLRPVLARVAMSVRYGEARKPEGKTPDPLAGTPFVLWTETGDKAFSLLVPSGWTVEGGLVRRRRMEPVPRARVTSPDGRIRLFFNHPRCALFRQPDRQLEARGCFEGRWYTPDQNTTIQVRSYLPGHRFLTGCVLPAWDALTDTRVLAAGRAPVTLGRELNELSRLENSTRKVEAGTVLLRGRYAGQEVLGYALVATQSWENRFGQGHWNAQGLCGWFSAPGLHRQAAAALRRCAASFKVLPGWAARQPGWTERTPRLRSRVFRAMARALDPADPALKSTFARLDREAPPKGDRAFWRDPATGDTFREARGHNWFWRRVPGKKSRADLAPPDLDLSPLVRF